MKKILSFFFIIWTVVLTAQETRIVKGLFIDKKSKDTIRNVDLLVIVEKDTIQTLRLQNEIFRIELIEPKSYLVAKHPMYEDLFIYPFLNQNKDSLPSKYILNPLKLNNLDVIHVKPKGVPEKVFHSDVVSVSDFEIMPNGNILLLVYPKTLKKGSEIRLYEPNSKETIGDIQMEEHAYELVRDFRGNPHIVCEKNVYGIYQEENNIGIGKVEKDYFMKYVAPILDTNHTKYYLTDFNKLYPSMNYYAFDQLDSTYSQIVNITDDFMMELYRAEYKWADVRTKIWAKEKQNETGIDAQIWVGATYFTQSIFYKEIYAPMFHRNDTIFVFDYYKDLLHRYNQNGIKIDSISIAHHYHPKETGWKKNLIQDKVTGQIYALFDEAGYQSLRRVDTNSGLLMEKMPLKYRYAENIQVNNNAIFYIYRPFESIQKKYLYKEEFPLTFEKQDVVNGDKSFLK